MKLRRVSSPDALILIPKGRLTGGQETDELRSQIAKAVDDNEKQVIIDLSDTLYLNSTALGILVSAHRQFGERGGRVKLCGVNKSIDNILVITKLSLVFEVYDTIEEAIKSFS